MTKSLILFAVIMSVLYSAIAIDSWIVSAAATVMLWGLLAIFALVTSGIKAGVHKYENTPVHERISCEKKELSPFMKAVNITCYISVCVLSWFAVDMFTAAAFTFVSLHMMRTIYVLNKNAVKTL